MRASADFRGEHLGYAGLQPEDPREIGPYKLLGQLGMGGMGQVFLGMSAGGRPIAVKVIRAELASDPDFRARFEREVAAAQRVSGLFTALVVDADLDGPTPWLATAYVAGPSLTETVRGHGPLPAHSLRALAAGLAEGLVPSTRPGWCIATSSRPTCCWPRTARGSSTSVSPGPPRRARPRGANVMIGSPGYMSPEQVLGRHVGPAGDMFSLGAVLTFAATGEAPFGHGSSAALMYRLVNNPPKLDGVPGDLRPLVGLCLAKDPGDRPSADQLLADLGAIQPAPGWLAESIMNSFAQTQSAAVPAELAEIVAPTSAGPVAARGFVRAAAGRQAGPVRGTGPSRTAPHLAPAGLGLPDRRPGHRVGGGRHRPDRRGPDAPGQRRPAAGRRGQPGDRARPGDRPGRPGRVALGTGLAVTELVRQPGDVLLRHLPGSDADQLGIGPAGQLRVRPAHQVLVVRPVVRPPSSSAPPSSSTPPSSRPAVLGPAVVPRRRLSAPPSSAPPSSAPPSLGSAVVFGSAVVGPAASSAPPSSAPASSPASAGRPAVRAGGAG